jgi:catechol 2,3-dioxygenase-like lactoylglutathione lyase family enzyme
VSIGGRLTAILPVSDLDAAQAFFERLGFSLDGAHGDYRLMSDGEGGEIHLNRAAAEWLVPGRNPFGLYLYRRDVLSLAVALAGDIIGDGEVRARPWGMTEFALNGPDDVLVRIGWPTDS